VGLGQIEALYRALYDLKGWTPRQVDECELWELASLLIRDEAKLNGQPSPRSGLTGRALLEARVRAAKEGRPPPEFGPQPNLVN